MNDEGRCGLCNRGLEDVLHVLRDRLKARAVWSMLIKPWQLHTFNSLPPKEWFVANLQSNVDHCNILFVILCWRMWRRRNHILFDPEFVELEDMIVASKSYMDHVLAANARLDAIGMPVASRNS
ncbi:hypothetical protein GQ457_03G003640 [Hibiscus cannabinus]